MAAVRTRRLARVCGLQLESDRIPTPRRVHRLVVELHARNAAQVHAALRWDADGRADLQAINNSS